MFFLCFFIEADTTKNKRRERVLGFTTRLNFIQLSEQIDCHTPILALVLRSSMLKIKTIITSASEEHKSFCIF